MLKPRREFLSLLATTALSLVAARSHAGPRARKRRRIRRRVHRRIRRRFRRRVAWRVVGARRALVVPLAVAVGWELAVASERAGAPDDVVVVRELKTVQVDNAPVEVAVVVQPDGKTREIEIAREDTRENSRPLEGSTLAEGAHAGTPHEAVDTEVEEEVDE